MSYNFESAMAVYAHPLAQPFKMVVKSPCNNPAFLYCSVQYCTHVRDVEREDMVSVSLEDMYVTVEQLASVTNKVSLSAHTSFVTFWSFSNLPRTRCELAQQMQRFHVPCVGLLQEQQLMLYSSLQRFGQHDMH